MKYLSWIYIFCLFSLNVGSVYVLFFSPDIRSYVQKQLEFRGQKALSVVYGDLMNDGSEVRVVKLKSSDGIYLEFYSRSYNGISSLINRTKIPRAVQDGFFDYRGKTVQLAVLDLDGDGKMELIAPTFDKNLIARLNPYEYNTGTQSFGMYNPGDEYSY